MLEKLVQRIGKRPEEKKTANAALYFIRKHTVVLFLQKKNRDGLRTQKLLQKLRWRYDLPSEYVITVEIDGGKDGQKLYKDLVALSDQQFLPQVFVNETYFGGYHEIKNYYQTGFLADQMLKGLGKCPECEDCATEK